MTGHAPTPYRVKPGDGKRFLVANDGHGRIATVHLRRTKTDNVAELNQTTALLAHAANSHADLVKALTLAVNWCEAEGKCLDMHWYRGAAAALAKAQEKP